MTERERTLREQMVEIGIRLLDNNLVQGTWGNISARVDADNMLVTPSAIGYYELKPEDMVLVNIHTLEYPKDGLKPTSEKGIHGGILSGRPEVNAIIHSHGNAGSVYAAAHAKLTVRDKELQKLFKTKEIKTAPYAPPGFKKLAQNTIAGIGAANAVFMANHGVMCCGKDLDEAYKVLEELEVLCAATLK